MKAVHLLGIAVIALLFGCATGYQHESFTGGFSDMQMAPDVFRVTFKGNGYTSPEKAQDFALLRASELTLQNGFSYFAVINESNSTAVSTYTTPSQSYTSGQVNSNGYYNASTTYYGGQTEVIFKPRTGMMIRCFKAKPTGFFAFDANFLQHSIKQKHELK